MVFWFERRQTEPLDEHYVSLGFELGDGSFGFAASGGGSGCWGSQTEDGGGQSSGGNGGDGEVFHGVSCSLRFSDGYLVVSSDADAGSVTASR